MKVITFGEIMMRLNPEGYLRFVQAKCFEASYAGGEANVAVSLANYGLEAAFVSKVPAHEIGQCAVNELRHFGVDTSMMLRGGDRLGLYFVEKGASQRASKVIYDRANSAIALAKKEEFDWEKIFAGADWFHFTGITPALGGQLPEICLEACKAAKAMGLKTAGLTGEKPCRMDDVCDIVIHVPETETYKIQEYHLPVYHYICAEMEKRIFG